MGLEESRGVVEALGWPERPLPVGLWALGQLGAAGPGRPEVGRAQDGRKGRRGENGVDKSRFALSVDRQTPNAGPGGQGRGPEH